MFRFIYMILETIIQLKWMFKSLLQHYTIVSGSRLAIVVIMLTFTGSEAEHTTLHLWTGGRSLCDVRILRNQRVCLDKIRRGDGHLGPEEVGKPGIYKANRPDNKNGNTPNLKPYRYREILPYTLNTKSAILLPSTYRPSYGYFL